MDSITLIDQMRKGNGMKGINDIRRSVIDADALVFHNARSTYVLEYVKSVRPLWMSTGS